MEACYFTLVIKEVTMKGKKEILEYIEKLRTGEISTCDGSLEVLSFKIKMLGEPKDEKTSTRKPLPSPPKKG